MMGDWQQRAKNAGLFEPIKDVDVFFHSFLNQLSLSNNGIFTK